MQLSVQVLAVHDVVVAAVGMVRHVDQVHLTVVIQWRNDKTYIDIVLLQ